MPSSKELASFVAILLTHVPPSPQDSIDHGHEQVATQFSVFYFELEEAELTLLAHYYIHLFYYVYKDTSLFCITLNAHRKAAGTDCK